MRQRIRKAILLIGPYPYNPYLIFLVVFSLFFARFLPLVAYVPSGSERARAGVLVILVSALPGITFSLGAVLLQRYRFWSNKSVVFYILEVTFFQFFNQLSLPVLNRFFEDNIGHSYEILFPFNFKILSISVALALFGLALIHQGERKIIERLEKADDLIEQLKSDRERLLNSDEEIRRQTSTFLHDRVQSELMVVSMSLKSIQGTASIEINDVIDKAISRLENTRSADLKNIIQVLSPNFEASGLKGSFESLIKQYESNMTVSIQIDPASEELDSHYLLGAYRIVEQGLLNSLIHGPAKKALVSITTDAAGRSEIVISDDGPGADLDSVSSGVGTAVIDSWVSILKGKKTVDTVPGHGYRLVVNFPA